MIAERIPELPELRFACSGLPVLFFNGLLDPESDPDALERSSENSLILR